MTTTKSKYNNNGKDNDSEDDSDNSKDNNNDGGNSDSGGGGISTNGGRDNVRLVAVLCGAVVVWCLHTVGIIQICFRILFWSKFSIWHVQTCRIEFILFVLIPGLFYVYSGLNLGLNHLDQFWQSPSV
jgi:hypothetical protein